jgi:hypothetical protein
MDRMRRAKAFPAAAIALWIIGAVAGGGTVQAQATASLIEGASSRTPLTKDRTYTTQVRFSVKPDKAQDRIVSARVVWDVCRDNTGQPMLAGTGMRLCGTDSRPEARVEVAEAHDTTTVDLRSIVPPSAKAESVTVGGKVVLQLSSKSTKVAPVAVPVEDGRRLQLGTVPYVLAVDNSLPEGSKELVLLPLATDRAITDVTVAPKDGKPVRTTFVRSRLLAPNPKEFCEFPQAYYVDSDTQEVQIGATAWEDVRTMEVPFTWQVPVRKDEAAPPSPEAVTRRLCASLADERGDGVPLQWRVDESCFVPASKHTAASATRDLKTAFPVRMELTVQVPDEAMVLWWDATWSRLSCDSGEDLLFGQLEDSRDPVFDGDWYPESHRMLRLSFNSRYPVPDRARKVSLEGTLDLVVGTARKSAEAEVRLEPGAKFTLAGLSYRIEKIERDASGAVSDICLRLPRGWQRMDQLAIREAGSDKLIPLGYSPQPDPMETLLLPETVEDGMRTFLVAGPVWRRPAREVRAEKVTMVGSYWSKIIWQTAPIRREFALPAPQRPRGSGGPTLPARGTGLPGGRSTRRRTNSRVRLAASRTREP